jgi:2'-5' RNA ligase
MRSAVVLPVDLPEPLEAIRRRYVAEATRGLPAHLTMLYPFVPAVDLLPRHVDRLASTVSRFLAFDYALVSIKRWPDAVYVAPRPEDKFTALAAALARDWPEWPLYGGGASFVPHITLATPIDEAVEAALAVIDTPVLPVPRRATELLVLVEDQDGRWSARQPLPLGA